MGRQALSQRLYDATWRLALRLRNFARRASLLGPFEPLFLKLVPLLVPPPRTETTVTLAGGMRMYLPPGYPAARSFRAGLYEREVTGLLQSSLTNGMTFVDLGANVGYYALLASRLAGGSGYVYAFEPDPTNYAYLQRSVEANGCRNIVAFQQAISDKTGSMNFIPDPHRAEGFLVDGDADGRSIAVQTVTLDDFFRDQGWPSIQLIKMDIEGSEQQALKGMTELRRKNPALQLIMEFNPGALRRSGATRETLAAVLQELNYHRGYVIEKALKPFTVAQGLPDGRTTYNLLLQPG